MPLAGVFCTLVGVFAPPPPRFAPLLRRGIRNRCAIACPLAEAANTFRFCFAADCVRGYVARPSPLTQASLRRGCVAQLARFAGKTKPVKVLTLTGVGVAGFEPAASSSRTVLFGVVWCVWVVLFGCLLQGFVCIALWGYAGGTRFVMGLGL